jgi:hypothetical protein
MKANPTSQTAASSGLTRNAWVAVRVSGLGTGAAGARAPGSFPRSCQSVTRSARAAPEGLAAGASTRAGRMARVNLGTCSQRSGNRTMPARQWSQIMCR